MYAKVEKLSRLQNIPHGFFNRTTWKKQSDPAYPLVGLPRSLWDKHQLSIATGDEPVWVDFIVNNLDEGAHPFHFVSMISKSTWRGHSLIELSCYQARPQLLCHRHGRITGWLDMGLIQSMVQEE